MNVWDKYTMTQIYCIQTKENQILFRQERVTVVVILQL